MKLRLFAPILPRCIVPRLSSVDPKERLDEDDFESKVNEARQIAANASLVFLPFSPTLSLFVLYFPS